MSEGSQYIGLTLDELRDRIETAEGTDRIMSGDANSRQVGGAHYKKGKLQHWDVVEKYGVPYLEGVGSKYPLRWREKGGLEDLEKTLHYIDKILERPSDHTLWGRRLELHTDLIWDSNELCEAHAVGPVERRVVLVLLQGTTRDMLADTRRELAEYIARLRLAEDGAQHATQEEPLLEPLFPTVTHIHLPPGSSGTIDQVGETFRIQWS